MVHSRVGLSGLLRGVLVLALAIAALASVNRAYAQNRVATVVSCGNVPVTLPDGFDTQSFSIDLVGQTCTYLPFGGAADANNRDEVRVGMGHVNDPSITGFEPLRVIQGQQVEHQYSCSSSETDFHYQGALADGCYFELDFPSVSATEVSTNIEVRDKITNELHAEFTALTKIVTKPGGAEQEVTVPGGVTFYNDEIPPEVIGVGFVSGNAAVSSADPGDSFIFSIEFDEDMDTSSAPIFNFYDAIGGTGSEVDLSAWFISGEWQGANTYNTSYTSPDPLSISAPIRSVIVSGVDSADGVALLAQVENVTFTVLQNILPNVSVDALVTTDTTPPLSGTVDDANASVSITVNGQTELAANDGAGGWSLGDNVLNELPFNTYDVVASATDMNGLVGVDTTTDELVVAAVLAPEIRVFSSIDGGERQTGDEDAFLVNAIEGVEQSVTYTVINDGNIALNLQALNTSGLTNIRNDLVNFGDGASSITLAPNESRAIEIKFTPHADGDYAFNLAIPSDDPDENPFAMTVSGTADVAEAVIQVTSWSGEIPLNLGNFDDGVAEMYTGVILDEKTEWVYSVTNLGNVELVIDNTGVGVKDGFPTDNGRIDVSPRVLTIDPGETKNVILTFTPVRIEPYRISMVMGSNAAGGRTVIKVDEDGEISEKFFPARFFYVAVEGVVEGPPEIEVSSSVNGVLTDGGTDALGNLIVGNETSVTYTIDNSTGTGPLRISDVSASTPTNLLNDTVTFSATSFDIAAGESASLTATFTPVAAGAIGFELDIDSNDADKSPFDITVSATGSTGAICLCE